MTVLTRLLRVEPVAITAAITATLAVLILAGVLDEAQAGVVAAAISAWLVVVRQMVTPVARSKPDADT